MKKLLLSTFALFGFISISNSQCNILTPDNPTLLSLTRECQVDLFNDQPMPTATDNCMNNFPGNPDAGPIINTQGSMLVTWTYDNGTVTATQTQDVFVLDTQAPVADVTTLPTLNFVCPVASLTPPTATDNCLGTINATTTTTFPITQSTTITWTYIDAAFSGGNVATQTQDIIIQSGITTNMLPATCSNSGPIDLNIQVSPMGGQFIGNGVDPIGFLDPMVAGPGIHPVIYTVYNQTEGCMDSATFNIQVLDVPLLSMTATDASCSDSTGTATVTATGGQMPYVYYWNTGADSVNLSGLLAGAYYVTVTDNNGCMATGLSNVGNTSINIAGIITDPSCFSNADGSIDLTIAGSGTYSILWSNGATTEDISNLSAGPYDISIVDNNGCEATETFVLNAPLPILANSIETNATCGASDGNIVLNVSGGTTPYVIQWFDVNNNPIPNISTIPAGTYSAQITDAKGCMLMYNTVVNENGGPAVSLIQVTDASCANDGAIDIDISTTGTIVSTIWSDGQTATNITGLSAGLYSVSVEDNNGCFGFLDVVVNSQLPTTPSICLVTVDSLTTTNLIVWEKPVSTTISHYNIYREGSQLGLYQFVDSVLYTDISEFVDIVANPATRSWRYRISMVNTCGVESPLSDYHKTIHTTINLGLGSNINILWDAYEGLTYTQFFCWRYTDVNGFEQIWTAASNIFSYTDVPPSTNGLDYVVGFPLLTSCSSSQIKATTYNGTRSNRSAGVFGNIGLSVKEYENTNFDVTLFPNPSNGNFKIHITGIATGKFDFKVMDLTGKLVLEGSETKRKFSLNLSNLEKGVYYLSITNNGVVEVKKVVIQ